MLKYKVTFVCDNGFQAVSKNHEVESDCSLSLNNPQDRDFLMRELKAEYASNRIRITRIKPLGARWEQ